MLLQCRPLYRIEKLFPEFTTGQSFSVPGLMSDYFVSAMFSTYSGTPCGEYDSYSTQKSLVKSAKGAGKICSRSTICLIDVAGGTRRESLEEQGSKDNMGLWDSMPSKIVYSGWSNSLPNSQACKVPCRVPFRCVCRLWKTSRMFVRLF